jgi:hypothetical protein
MVWYHHKIKKAPLLDRRGAELLLNLNIALMLDTKILIYSLYYNSFRVRELKKSYLDF